MCLVASVWLCVFVCECLVVCVWLRVFGCVCLVASETSICYRYQTLESFAGNVRTYARAHAGVV